MLSQNGYLALPAPRFTGDLPRLRRWRVPGTSTTVVLRDGSVGFLLTHLALWLHEQVEPIDKGHPADDWGYAYRAIRGATRLSNHASGSALDYNATRHPLGKRGTFSRDQAALIRAWLEWRFSGAIRWGGDYQRRADEMHFELVIGLDLAEALARRLCDSPRGARVLDANPGAREVIFS